MSKDSVLQLRITEEEHAELKRRADAVRLSLSGYCRLVLQEARVEVRTVHTVARALPEPLRKGAQSSSKRPALAETTAERLQRQRAETIKGGGGGYGRR